MAGKINLVLVNWLAAMLVGLMMMWFFGAAPIVSRAAMDGVSSALSYVELPAEELVELFHLTRSWVLERSSLQRRNAELEGENLMLRTALAEAKAPVPAARGDLIGARVTLRYPDQWWRELRIDKGTNDGVNVGAPALADGYMIGRVVRTGETFAWIELVTSSSFMLAAVVDDTWDLGVINGDDIGGIWLMYVPQEREYTKGMSISTALVGDHLPPGIPLGTVVGKGDPRDGYVPQMIASGARLSQIYSVQVLRSVERRTEN